MLSAAIAAATLSQSQLAVRFTSKVDDRATAQAGAEQGLAEAIARLRLNQTLPFDGDGQLPQGTFEYSATLTTSTTVQINASSTLNDATRTVQATLEQTGGSSADVVYTAFANSLVFSQSGFGNVEGRIGTNGTFQFNSEPPGDVQEVFSPLGSCPGCPNLIESAGPASFPEPVLPNGPTRSCPSYHWFQSVVDGQNGIPFVCTGNSYLVLAYDLEVINPPLVIYADSNRTVYVYRTDVNKGGRASDLQVYARSQPGSSGALNLWYSDVSMEIYAPGRSTTPYDYQSTGMLVVDALRLTNRRRVYLRPDPFAPEPAPPLWAITDWRTVTNP